MKITTRERRDWTLLIFIIPIGIIFMLIAGQIAIRIVPQWSVNAGMQSQLDPSTAPKQQAGLVPVLPEILTPLGWFDTFLTPNSGSGDDIVFPPFIVFEPTATPSPTNPPTASPTVTETVTTTVTPSPTVVTTVPSATPTKKPPNNTPTPTTATICTDPLASNFNGPLPCTYPPTVCTDPLATNFNGPLPCTYPPTTCTDPLASNFNGPLPCVYPSTIDPGLIADVPPSETNLGTPDGTIGAIMPGHYVVINLNGNPIVVSVNGTSETNYDLVYYESDAGAGNILMDSVILGISKTDLSTLGSIYYEIFNWGGNTSPTPDTPDTNTNVDTNDLPADPGCVAPAAPECDNRSIPTSELHPGPGGGTGILIDVDNAPSAPPPGSYQFLVIISPDTNDDDGDSTQVDSVEVKEVLPTP